MAEFTDQCYQAAKFLAGHMHQCGCDLVELMSVGDGLNPLVMGRITTDPSNPTVFVYGHYDVVPAVVRCLPCALTRWFG